MKGVIHTFVFLLLFAAVRAQTYSPAPYCTGSYGSGNCNQGGPSNSSGNWINDFINTFVTDGGNSNISNVNSGCNNGPSNYAFYCSSYLAVSPSQVITCTLQSGITFAQGFAIWVDWNQDNTFQNPGEQVAATSNVPPAASYTTLTFTVPANQPNGVYRLRVKCSFATAGTNITPCGNYTYGETEDYNLYVGTPPSNSGVITATLVSNSPICAGQTLSLTTITPYTGPLSYTWTGPGNFTSNAQSPVMANASPTMSGTYSVLITNSLCPITRSINVRVVAYPTFTPNQNTDTICQGGNFTAFVQLPPGSGAGKYDFFWASPTGTGNTIWNPYSQSTLIQPLLLPVNVTSSTLVYSITVSDTTLFCPITKTLALTINNPLTPTLSMPPPICNTFSPLIITATPGGGTWSTNSAVSPIGLLTPAIATIGVNQVMYSVASGTCLVSNTGTFSVSKFISPALTSSLSMVCEQDGGYNLMSIVQNTTGSWQGVNTAGNIFVPTGLATGVYNFTYNTTSTPIASVCPASTVLAVSVFKPPVPVISHINATCNNGPTVALTANPSGGSWTLNPGVSLSGIQTPSLNSIGTNTVTYIAGQGTCVASSSATFHVSQFNTAALTGTVPNLCVTASPVNLMAIVQSTLNGSWNGPGLITTGGYSFSPAFLPTAVYTLTYNTTSSPQAGLCDHSSTIKVSVFNPPVPNITQVGPYCSTDAPLQLTVSPATGTWTALSYINKSGLFTPSLAAIGNNLVQYIIGTPTCNTQQTKFISVEGFVSAHISSRLPELCNTSSAVNLIPLTVNGSGVWSGTGVQGTYFNPSASGAGNFTLSYQTASSPSGLCPDKDTLSVRVYSLAAPLVTSQAPLCDKSEPVQLQVSPLGGIFGGANTSAISSSGMFNPAFGIIGDNIVSYSIASGPCLAYAQTTISVAKFVSADFGKYPEAFCQNSQPMNLNSLVLNPGGQWSGKGITGSMFNPLKAEIGLNTVEYRTYSDPYPLLCPDSKTISIRVDKMPVISVAGTTMGCAPLQAVFTMPQTNLGQGEWNTGDSDVLYPGTDLVHIYTTPGSYSVTFNYTLGACQTRTTLANPVVVYPSPVTDFSFSKPELTIAEPEVTLNNLTPALGDYKYQWDIQGQETRYEVNPTVSFPEAGTWHVTLKATSLNNCIAEITKTILVKNEIGVYVPNVFTPNADGLNDVFLPVFTPYGLDETSFRMQIFDRWGHLVYSTSDLTKGWDGSYQNKGELAMKQEVYIYTLRYKDLDGQLHEQTGYVSLMPK